ncbi:hypothetical protein [Ruania zhangjianzhongii]|uniref:hypothetical protein n=1 Tax=Ruania zhangjianzhongii TaxID=2603206 RepID=UPI0011C8B2F3|nr:hypothetical protein [Ruania zhangjianzhongii]
MSVKRIRNAATGLLATVALTMTAFVGLSGAAQAVPDRPPPPDTGCPSGAVCVYPGTGWNGGDPTYVFWSYDAHRIYNQYGDHRVFNNQTGGAHAVLSPDSDGSSWTVTIPAGTWTDENLTPINSVSLFPQR